MTGTEGRHPTGLVERWIYPPLLISQGAWAARRTPRLPPAAGPREGIAGDSGHGPERVMLAIGDSIIAGVGVGGTEEALPARLAVALAARGRCRVRWRAHGRNGARSGWLMKATDAAVGGDFVPDLVVVSNGINDVTTLGAEAKVLARLTTAVEALERRFPEALIAQLALPPLGVFPALPRPLRPVLGRRADRIDRALEDWLAPRPRSHWLAFESLPRPEQFARDGYHPAAAAVADWAESLAGQLSPLLPDPRAG